MGIFNRNFDRPGPGVAKDAPRKKGAARFFEVLGRDWGSFFKASLLCLLGYIPWTLLVGIGVLGQNLIFTLAGGLVGGVIAGPTLAGMHDTVLRSMRDEPGFWWHVYKRAFKNNWRASMAPGALLGFLTAGQLFMLWFIVAGGLSLGLGGMAMLALNLLLTGMCVPFVFGQLVLMNMSFVTLLKNSLFLALGHAVWALVMALVQIVYWGAMLLMFPLSVPLLVVLGFVPVTVFCQQIAYGIMDKVFGLEEQFRKKREAELTGESGE